MSESKKYILEYIRAFTMKCLEQTDVDLFFNNVNPNIDVDIKGTNEASDKETVKEVTEAVSEMTESGAETAVETAREAKEETQPHINSSFGPSSKSLPEFVQELYDTIFDLRDFSENADNKKDGKDSKIVAM